MINKKRSHRTKAEMDVIRGRIISAIEENPEPLTLRGVYYRVASLTPARETVESYNSIKRLLGQLREDDVVSWKNIIDARHPLDEPYTFPSLASYVERMTESYRRALWDDADARPVITLEKEALADRVREITDPLDVPLLPFGGYPSITSKHEFAEWIEAQPQAVHVFHFGDWNPSGEHIGNNFAETLRRYGARTFTFTRVALTETQIRRWKLITRPVNDDDARSPSFSGKVCCDLDALTKAQLQSLVRGCLTPYVDEAQVARITEKQEADRKKLTKLATKLTVKKK
jgi:hypothetical protein